MQSQAENNEAVPHVVRRADVSGVLHVEGKDRAASDRLSTAIAALADASAHGPIAIAHAYNERAACVTLNVRGSLAAVLRLLNSKSPGGERVVDDRTPTSFEATIDNVGVEKAVAINDHLLNAAKNHPPGDPSLDVRTEHDERDTRLRVLVSGSLFATAYLLFLVSLHLTQSRN